MTELKFNMFIIGMKLTKLLITLIIHCLLLADSDSCFMGLANQGSALASIFLFDRDRLRFMDSIHRLCLSSSNKQNSNDDASISESRIRHVAVSATSQSAFCDRFGLCFFCERIFLIDSPKPASLFYEFGFRQMQELWPFLVSVT